MFSVPTGKEKHRLTFPITQKPWLYSISRYCQGVFQRQKQKPVVGPHLSTVFCLPLDDTESVFPWAPCESANIMPGSCMSTFMGSAVFYSFGYCKAFSLSDGAHPMHDIQILHLSTFQGHFCQYWCPWNQNDCRTNLVPKLMDQAFATLDQKKKNNSTSWTFGSWIDAATVHSIRSGIKNETVC